MPARRSRQTAVVGDSRPLAGVRTAARPKQAPRATTILSRLSEREFQRIVVTHLRSRGWLVWHVPNMRQTTAGLPDLFCIHAGYRIVLLWELKAEKTKVTPIQKAVIDVLQDVPGIDARIVRPSDWEALRDGLLAALARSEARVAELEAAESELARLQGEHESLLAAVETVVAADEDEAHPLTDLLARVRLLTDVYRGRAGARRVTRVAPIVEAADELAAYTVGLLNHFRRHTNHRCEIDRDADAALDAYRMARDADRRVAGAG